MITLEEMFGKKIHHRDATEERVANAIELLKRVNSLLTELEYEPPVCPFTDCQISGSMGGSGDGGFRLQNSKTGATYSSHKQGQAVDIFDPRGRLDSLITDKILREHNLFRESPSATPGWCHLTTRPPKSFKRTFLP